MDKQIPTPLTDALHRKLVALSESSSWIAGKDYVDMAAHSRQLERDRAELLDALETLLKNGSIWEKDEHIAHAAIAKATGD